MNFDDFCIYMAGFDRLGRYLYGSWWTGNEHNAYPAEPPEKITAEKLNISEQIDKTHVKLSHIRNERRKSLSAKQITELAEQERAISEKLRTINKQFYELPYDIDSHTKDYDEYMRRVTTNEYLQQALESDSVMAWFGLSPMGIRWSEWGNRDGFTLYPELSMIHTRNSGRNRRMTVFFKVSDFDKWLETLEPLNPEARPGPSTEDLYRSLIREFYATLNGRLPKIRFEKYVRSKVDTFRPRTFNDAWAHEESIPDEWKESGNIRKSERHKE